MAIATESVVALATQIRGRRYCDEIVATEQKTLRRGNIHAFPWILPRFSVAKLITCTSAVALQKTMVDQNKDKALTNNAQEMKGGCTLAVEKTARYEITSPRVFVEKLGLCGFTKYNCSKQSIVP